MTNEQDFRYWRTLDPQLRGKVRELRRDPTPCEQTFWNAVRGKAIEGIKFRRQHPFENFILDFYAPEIKLAVEIDGDVHDSPGRRSYDRWREEILRMHGLRVVQFTNAEIALDLDRVTSQLRGLVRDLQHR